MPSLQDSIHKLEEGGGLRPVRIGLAVLLIFALTALYDWRVYRNFGTQEAMDAAQVGRNLAEGRGFSTQFIRPFSIFLLKRHAQTSGRTSSDPAHLKSQHPDLANPPVWPIVVAGLLKTLPFEFEAPPKFMRYGPDFLIAIFNQVLFICAVGLVFLLARRLFDSGVARLSAILMLTTEVLWHFSASGLSTMLLLLWFLGLVWLLVLIEQEGREPRRGLGTLLGLAFAIGLLMGVGTLTRYAFGWLIVPVAFFLFLFGGERRVAVGLLTLLVFGATITPWIARNLSLSGTPFGTAGYSVLETTFLHPQQRLMRSLEPDLNFYLKLCWLKFLVNFRHFIEQDFLRVGGSWAGAFFLCGLMVRFRNPAISRLRYFLLGALAVLAIVQCFGKTQLSEDSPDINSENLMVLLLPLVVVYGVSFFFLLLDQISFPAVLLRYLVILLFGGVASLPLIFAMLPPRADPRQFPPYEITAIQRICTLVKTEEWMMTDVPWAVAWYGQRQSIWLTLNAQQDFLSLHDYQKPIALVYLTTLTTDRRFASQFLDSEEKSWGNIIGTLEYQKQVPAFFPLRAHVYYSTHVLLSDWERWKRPSK
jgi:hypothetical protein